MVNSRGRNGHKKDKVLAHRVWWDNNGSVQTETTTHGDVEIVWKGQRPMKIKIKRVKTGYYFKIVARNGRTLCHSEVYNTLAAAKKTMFNLKDKLAFASWEVV